MERLFKFIELTKRFRAVKRKVVFAEDNQPENDAEHSYQLALTAWYIVESERLELNLEKVFEYALTHDLVEAYAGDTPSAVHRDYEAERNTKKEREEEAARRIGQEFPEFAELHRIIERYEKREDEESRFVYALDKVMPILNIYLDEGYAWKANGVKIEDVIQYKKEQIAESPAVKKYFDLLVPMLRALPKW